MNLLRRARASMADRIPTHSPILPKGEDAEDALLYQDFIDSISLNDEELEAFIAMPGCSVPEVRQLFQGR